jgi:hypothetical protein
MANAANIVKLKRSAIAGKAPNTADLQLGELALNTYDGRLFFTTTQDSGSTYNLATLQPFPTGGSSGQILSLDSSGNLIWSTKSGTGTVTSVSVVSANGFTGTVATSGTTPAITIATSVTGLLKGNGTSISAATASTDYVIPSDLSSYVTSTSLSSTLSSYVTSSTLSSYNYITLASLSMDTPASASGSGNVQYNSATGKFKYTPPDLSSYLTASSTLDASKLSGTIPSTVLGNSTVYIGTTAVALNRTTASISLTGTSIDGNAATVTNGVYTTGSYSDPTWLTISKSKVGLGNVENTALSTWAGSTNITTLGTITSGVWHGTAIANSYLANSTIVLNGVTLTLGDTNDTIKASTTNALTIGTGLSGTSFNGSTAVTIAIDNTVVTLSGSQTLTNKTLTSPIIGTIVNTGTLTLPTSTDTLVGRDTTDTFTNKTFDTAGTGNVFKISGTAISAVTGTGSVVLANSPTLVTPTLGVASVTSVNKLTITTPATGSTLTIADGKTLTASNTLTFTGTDASSVAFGAGGTVLYTSSTLDASKLSGTIPSTVLGNSTVYIGTTAVNLNRATGSISLTGTSIDGNAGTATTLQTARNINGVSFNGSQNITVKASTTNALTIGTGLTGTSFDGSSATTIAVDTTTIATRSYVTGLNYITLTSLSTGTPNSASGSGSISYSNTTGVFTYTPPDLSSYVTSTSLSSTLGSYVTSSSLSTTLSSYVTSSTLSGYNYITLTSLSMDTPGAASGSGSVTYSNSNGKFKYTPPDLSSYITASVATLSSLTSIGTTGVDTTAAGNLIVSGNLTVNGTTETINSTTSTFADKNIELAKPVSPATASDSGANGGGITLHGTTDKTLNWVLSTLAWTSSENFDIANNKTYKINGTDVLSSTALGTAVTGSSLTSVGTITSGTWHGNAIANSYLANSTIVVNGVTLTLGDTGDTIKASTTNALTIGTGLSGTSFDGSSAVTIALATGYGDTQNPYASKTAKYILAAPNSTNGAPTFRALVASDIPTLNQDTTGNAGTVTNGVYTTGSYADPGWITSLSQTKVLPTQTGNNDFYLTTNGTTATWTAFPTASTTQLGGVKVDGTTITINNGVISSAGSGGSLTTSSFDYWAGILIMG